MLICICENEVPKAQVDLWLLPSCCRLKYKNLNLNYHIANNITYYLAKCFVSVAQICECDESAKVNIFSICEHRFTEILFLLVLVENSFVSHRRI